MNELNRLAYLEAMGVDSFVSRGQLPGAAVTKRLRLVQPKISSAPEARAQGHDHGAELLNAVRSSAPPVASSDAVEVSPVPDKSVDMGPVFSVVSARVGGWLWLDEVARSSQIPTAYTKLIQGMARSLNWVDGDSHLERFDWPIADTRQLGNSDSAARDGFSGFLNGRLERFPVEGVVLLGTRDKPWLDTSLLTGVSVIATVSAWDMLRAPELKQRAWRDLKSQRRD